MTDAHDPILFLSGAGLSPWVWDDVREQLDADSAVARPPSGLSDAPLVSYAEAAIEAAPAGRFAIVAHSSGGVVGAEVARLVPSRVTAFLAISAVIPTAGGSFVSAMPAPNRWVLATTMRLGGTRPPAKAIRRGLGGGLRDNVAETHRRGVHARIARPLHGPDWAPRVGRSSWLPSSTQDKELLPALQRRFAQRLGGDWFDEIATGHLPMLQNAQATADAIDGFLTE